MDVEALEVRRVEEFHVVHEAHHRVEFGAQVALILRYDLRVVPGRDDVFELLHRFFGGAGTR